MWGVVVCVCMVCIQSSYSKYSRVGIVFLMSCNLVEYAGPLGGGQTVGGSWLGSWKVARMVAIIWKGESGILKGKKICSVTTHMDDSSCLDLCSDPLPCFLAKGGQSCYRGSGVRLVTCLVLRVGPPGHVHVLSLASRRERLDSHIYSAYRDPLFLLPRRKFPHQALNSSPAFRRLTCRREPLQQLDHHVTPPYRF